MFSANASQAASGAGAANYIEDVFSTYLYTGNGTSQSINNGIDLAGKGGLTWIKKRNAAEDHILTDTVRGAGNTLFSNLTSANEYDITRLSAFTSSGFSVGTSFRVNQSSNTYASWTFRKQPKFFDVVTWTGDGASSRAISHNLGSTPGCVIVKRTNNIADWVVYHRSVTGTTFLNLTDAVTTANNLGTVTAVDSTTFTVTAGTTDGRRVNSSANTYVAYLFAHNAGGFGLTGTDNVISCGSYTGNGSTTGPIVTLGYEPQWVMIKRATGGTGDWFMYDSMRGIATGGVDAYLSAQAADAEGSAANIDLNATGFQLTTSGAPQNASGSTYIYIAIRRGPMKTPTSGTSVFDPETATASTGTSRTIGFPADMSFGKARTITASNLINDRLRGYANSNTTAPSLYTNLTSAEDVSGTSASVYNVWNTTALDGAYFNGFSTIWYHFRRAPGFFDEVCYTGTGSTTSRPHNLGVTPQMIILKGRSQTSGTEGSNWAVWVSSLGTSQLFLNGSYAYNDPGTYINMSATASTFTESINYWNLSGQTYVAYLFASCPGVSKVGSYTGTGATQTISCGFAARFVLIKRTDSTGDWFVWDTARGMVAGTDPRLALNSTAAESNANWVYTNASGFQIVTTDATVNASGGSYIFLAIA